MAERPTEEEKLSGAWITCETAGGLYSGEAFTDRLAVRQEGPKGQGGNTRISQAKGQRSTILERLFQQGRN